jgi:hypothetical protein
MTDIFESTSPDDKASYVVTRRLAESAQNIVLKMRGGGKRKRAAVTATKRKRKTRIKRGSAAASRNMKPKLTKRDIFP